MSSTEPEASPPSADPKVMPKAAPPPAPEGSQESLVATALRMAESAQSFFERAAWFALARQVQRSGRGTTLWEAVQIYAQIRERRQRVAEERDREREGQRQALLSSFLPLVLQFITKPSKKDNVINLNEERVRRAAQAPRPASASTKRRPAAGKSKARSK